MSHKMLPGSTRHAPGRKFRKKGHGLYEFTVSWKEDERSELKWNEMHEMNELTWIKWHEWLEMKELKRMRWNEWIVMNELKWKNWNEGIEVN